MIRHLTMAAGAFLLLGSAAAQPPREPSREDLQDEIDLLEAKVQVKRVQITATEDGFKLAKEKLEQTRTRVAAGVTEPSVLIADTQALTRFKTEHAQQQGELKELEIKLRQAKRRVAGGPQERQRLEIEVRIFEARLMGKLAEVEKARALVKAAEAKVHALEKAVKKGIVPKEEYERAHAELLATMIDVKIAEAAMREAEAHVQLARLRLEAAGPAVKPEPVPPPKK